MSIPTNEISKEIAQLEKKAKNVPCKALLILSNKVIEVNDNVVATGWDVRRVDKYKANINLSFYNGLKKLNKKIVRFAWKEVRIEKIT